MYDYACICIWSVYLAMQKGREEREEKGRERGEGHEAIRLYRASRCLRDQQSMALYATWTHASRPPVRIGGHSHVNVNNMENRRSPRYCFYSEIRARINTSQEEQELG